MNPNSFLQLAIRARRSVLLLLAMTVLSGSVVAQPATLVAYWDFNDASDPARSVATVGGFSGVFTNNTGNAANNPAYSPDTWGASGQPGDRALNFGTDQAYRMMRCTDVAAALNAAAATDKVSVTFRQRYTGAVGSSSSFYFSSPSSSGNWRGFQAHAPWSGNTVYFDTAGCCTVPSQRINGAVGINYQQWHLYAFIKDGGAKQVVANGTVYFQQASGATALPTDFTEVLVGAAYVVGAPSAAVANNVRGLIDDFAIWQGTLTAGQLRLLAQGMTPIQVGTDSDNDTLPDGWEDLYGLDKNNPADATLDPDADGLTNLQEYEKNTHPRNPDTDGDGALDGWETNTGFWLSPTDRGTDPLNPDTDNDFLLDGVEDNTGVFVDAAHTGTNPTLWDSDFDGFGDGAEVTLGSSPVNPANTPGVGTGARILAYWDFNDASAPTQAVDRAHSLLAYFPDGVVMQPNGHLGATTGVVYTADAAGFTGRPGDRAVDFGTNSAQRVVRSRAIAPYLQAAAAYDPVSGRSDAISLSFWQKWTVTPVGSSIFWVVSPSMGAATQYRGLQAHNPNGSGGPIYYDTAGCCALGAQRMQTPAPPSFNWQQWHHFVFIKDGTTKQIWIDGQLLTNSVGANPLPADFTELILGASYPALTAQFLGLLDDVAVYGSGLTPDQVQALYYGLSPLDVDQATGDADSDGMPDWWEVYWGFDKNSPADAALDADSDGLTNLQEYQRKTLPRNPDTDGDGFRDGVETGTGFWTSLSETGTDPLNPDVDGDGLLDGAETKTGIYVSPTDAGTDPFSTDSDFDGYPDYTEVLLGSNPVEFTNVPITPGAPNLLAYWDFNNATVTTQAVDRIHSFIGAFEGEAAYSADGAGRSGRAGDRAVNLGTNFTARVRNAKGQWLSAIGPNDAVTVSYWEKWLTPIASTFAFFGISPSSVHNLRGISAHSPWGDGVIYWDTGGASAPAYRINANINTIAPFVPGYTDANGFFTNKWRHFAFVKNGGTKQIWIDGILFLEAANTAALKNDFTQFLMGDCWFSSTALRGLMDDFAIYGSALDATQIQALAQGASPIDFIVPPVLTITKSGANQVTLTWSGTGFILQTNANLALPAGWANVPGATTSPVVQTVPESGSLFFRLKQQ